MNTALLKTFGQKARTILIDGVTRKLHYWGFDKDGKPTEQPEPVTGGYLFREAVYGDPAVPRLWQNMKAAIAKDGLQEVAEQAAYIWFNRLVALQILSKNGYEQRLLEPASFEEKTPVIVKKARAGQYAYLNKTEANRLQEIVTDYEKETSAFAILIIGFCHSHPLLKRVFGRIDDYTELLLPDDILQAGGFLDLLNSDSYITQDDYKQVELIGWLYQFYISEKKDLVFKKFKDGKKAEAADIPAATQIFTPNWIVKYMVENTVGKIWLESKPDSPLKAGMKYLVESANTEETLTPIISEVKELKLLDPAVGSGHILVEGFELLYKMYEEEYYPADEAVESILQYNLYGLDIDLRAAQLAQFAVLMRAAQYYPNILQKPITPHIYAMPAPVHFTKDDVQAFLGNEGTNYMQPLGDALHLMLQAQNLGSIMQFDWSQEARIYIFQQFINWRKRKDLDLLQQELLQKLTPYLNILEVLTQQYEAIAANPPYMGQGNMNGQLKLYVNRKYLESKSDLFAVFMDVCHSLLSYGGLYGMINQHAWMFLSSFEDLRKSLLSNQKIYSMLHLGPRAFEELAGEVVQSTCFVIKNIPPNKKNYSKFYRLIEYKSSEEKKRAFASRERTYLINQTEFNKISGYPLAYWCSNTFITLFEKNDSIGDIAISDGKNITGNNEKYVRNLWEVSKNKVGLQKKWFLYTKGGGYRKWYGNIEHVIDWSENARQFYRSDKISRIIPEYLWYKRGISWNWIASSEQSFRILPSNATFDGCAPSIFFPDEEFLDLVLSLLNSIVGKKILEILNPTIGYPPRYIKAMPIPINLLKRQKDKIATLSQFNQDIAKQDWNSHELSWDFHSNSLLECNLKSLKSSLDDWHSKMTSSFFAVHSKEEELNRIFIEMYGLQDELAATVMPVNITLFENEIDYEKIGELQLPFKGQLIPVKREICIQKFISYIIGCFMGRYRLDKPGLQIAHPNPSIEELAPYAYTSFVTGEDHQIEIDEDAIIPMMGSKSNFKDDVTVRLRQFLVAIWGEATLTQNINFIQECLNQDVEDYLVKKFWPYHVRTYSKKPIYWLFSSKKGAFQALVYMHRMNRFTVEKLRDKYLLKHILFLGQERDRLRANSATLSKVDQKKLDAIIKDLQECEEYDLLLKDKATDQIEFDLDDGVTRNYELFKGVVAPIK